MPLSKHRVALTRVLIRPHTLLFSLLNIHLYRNDTEKIRMTPGIRGFILISSRCAQDL